MGFAAIIRFLVPRADHFYTFLERQAVVAHDGAVALSAFVEGNGPMVRDAVQDFEHQGDSIVHEMEEALARTFVTPIDREDLHSLSTTIDDILDRTNSAARACALFGIERPSEAMTKLMAVLVKCTEVLRTAMPKDAEVCAVTGPCRRVGRRAHACSDGIVVDVREQVRQRARRDRKCFRPAHEHRPDAVVRAIHAIGKPRVHTSYPRRKWLCARHDGEVHVVTHDRVAKESPIRFVQRTAEESAVMLAFGLGRDEPLAIDEA